LAKQNQTHWFLAETYLLISKLNLVELNINETRKYLNLAQTFAEEKGFKLLAKRISHEHDKILDVLTEWEQISEEEVDLIERTKEVDLEKQIKAMTRHEETKIQEEEEKPIQLMLLSSGGVTFYSRDFDPEFILDELLVGGLMTAIYSFSSEVFSQALERLKIGSYTVIIQRNEPILFCYVYEGQSYGALHKVNTLSSAILEDKKILDDIDKRTKTGTKLTGEYKKSVDHLIDDLFVAQTS
ncbi:MAG: hypothetical protein KAR35_10560, partial [Candidatus Heimdallarchaeota archaeon]|nr:hypothetical protein [Candidatus Heimdallarchaeota archaeon]MCK5049799.1 hypothetical protein [Candidatus Heimdallarchaeota archaeon]